MTALAFASAIERGTDASSNAVAHQALLDELNQVAAGDGWSGSRIAQYVVIGGYVSITIEPADRPATIFDLRRFRDEQKRIEAEQAEEGRLF
jgi:hypothetical protein